MARDQNGHLIDAFQLGINQNIAASAVSVAVAAAFGGQTRAVRVSATKTAFIAFGISPVATLTGTPIKATDPPEIISVIPGYQMAALGAATAGGTVSVTELK